jgi:hypothetical protein
MQVEPLYDWLRTHGDLAPLRAALTLDPPRAEGT